MDDVVAGLRRRAEIAEGFVAVLTEQLRAAEQRDHTLQAQIRQLTALVEGMQEQLSKALAELAARDKKKPKKEEPQKSDAEEEDQIATESAPVPAPDPPPEHKDPVKAKRKPKRPAKLPAHLPRQIVQIPMMRCERCGGDDLAGVGEGEVSERYHYVPAQIVVERTERATCRCRTCGSFTTAPMPPTAVPGGSMTAALYAHIAYSKCCMHLTLDRIADDLRRLGAVTDQRRPEATVPALGETAACSYAARSRRATRSR